MSDPPYCLACHDHSYLLDPPYYQPNHDQSYLSDPPYYLPYLSQVICMTLLTSLTQRTTYRNPRSQVHGASAAAARVRRRDVGVRANEPSLRPHVEVVITKLLSGKIFMQDRK